MENDDKWQLLLRSLLRAGLSGLRTGEVSQGAASFSAEGEVEAGCRLSPALFLWRELQHTPQWG